MERERRARAPSELAGPPDHGSARTRSHRHRGEGRRHRGEGRRHPQRVDATRRGSTPPCRGSTPPCRGSTPPRRGSTPPAEGRPHHAEGRRHPQRVDPTMQRVDPTMQRVDPTRKSENHPTRSGCLRVCSARAGQCASLEDPSQAVHVCGGAGWGAPAPRPPGAPDSARPQQPPLLRQRLRQLPPRLDVELSVGVPEVVLDGLRGDEQERRDLPIALAARRQLGDPALARCQ